MYDKLFYFKLYVLEQLKLSNKCNCEIEEFVITLPKEKLTKLLQESQKSDAKLLYKLHKFEEIIGEDINRPLSFLAAGMEEMIPPTRGGRIFKKSFETFENETYRHAFIKVITYLILKAKSVCIKQYPNDPIKKNQCFIYGLKSLLNHFKSEKEKCEKTKKPFKCEKNLERKIEEVEEDIQTYQDQIKQLKIKVK